MAKQVVYLRKPALDLPDVCWGLFSPQTGVRSEIGAPKLELLSQRIWERAKQLGVDPKVMRDYVLRGGAHAGIVGGIIGPGLSGREEFSATNDQGF